MNKGDSIPFQYREVTVNNYSTPQFALLLFIFYFFTKNIANLQSAKD